MGILETLTTLIKWKKSCSQNIPVKNVTNQFKKIPLFLLLQKEMIELRSYKFQVGDEGLNFRKRRFWN